jgi:hypothetical protein
MAAVLAVIKPKSVERLAMSVDRQQITSDLTNLLLNLVHRQTTRRVSMRQLEVGDLSQNLLL